MSADDYGLAVTERQRSDLRVSAVRFELGKAIMRSHDRFPELTYEEILDALLIAAGRAVGHMRSDHPDAHPCGPPTLRGLPAEPGGEGGAMADLLRWVGDELEATTSRGRVLDIDVIDHIRCFADQPDRRSIVPWPATVPRPSNVAKILGLEAPDV